MKLIETGFDGLIAIEPDIFSDERGHFFECYHQIKYKNAGIPTDFLQDNQSFSEKGVLRGLHFQKKPFEQGKLVRVITGKALDVVVDLRPNSKTFGKHFSYLLDSSLNNLLYVPEGFAHGFVTLEKTIFHYKCTNIYNKESDSGIIWNDTTLNIDWQIQNPIISEKDQTLPTFQDFLNNIE